MSKSTKIGLFFLLVLVVYFGLSMGIDFIPKKYITVNFSYMFGQFSIGIPVAVYIIATKGAIIKDISFKKIKIENVPIIVILAWLCMPISSFLNVVTMMFSENLVAGSIDGLSNNLFIVNLLMIAVLPAVIEELAYRGIVFYGLRQYGVAAAMIISGLLFGLNHMNINQFAYAFILGMYFCIIDEATDSIIASMLMHFTFNFSTVFSLEMMKILPYLEKMSGKDVSKQVKSAEVVTSLAGYSTRFKIGLLIGFGIVAVIAAVANFFVFKWYAGRVGSWEHICTEFKNFKAGFKKTDEGRIISVPMIMGMLFCIFIMILQLL